MDDVHLVSATPTLDAAVAYADGDAMHVAAMEFDVSAFRDAGGFVLDGVTIADKADQGKNIDLALFSADVADETINTAFDPTDAEIFTFLALVKVTTHSSFNANAVSIAANVGIPLKLAKSATSQILYGFLVAREAGTYGAADLKVTLHLRRA